MTTAPTEVASPKSEAAPPAVKPVPSAPNPNPNPNPTPAPGQGAVERIVKFWHRIHERKLVQWALAYVGVSLGVLHGVELVGHPFHWPMFVTRIVIGLLIVGFPIVLTLAWYHGDRGHQRFTQGEMTIISLLILIGAGMLVVLVKSDAEEPVVAATKEAPASATSTVVPANGKLRLAVLPFENLSPDPANAFFADGMHEEIRSTLANSATNMDVISRTTMMLYRATPKSISDVARELGVTHVLEGSVRRDGQTVRVSLQLIDAGVDRQLWSQTYDRKLMNAMTLQSQVAAEVATQLAVKLVARDGQLPPSSNSEAYDLFLKAWLQSETFGPQTALQDIQRAEDWLNRVIALDPSFAAAYLERSRLRARKFFGSYDMSEVNLRSLRSDLEMVRRLAGEVPLALALESQYAFVVESDLEKALRLLDSPPLVASKDAEVIASRASLLGDLGRLDESFALFARAAELDPASQTAFGNWQAQLWVARRPAEALRVIHAYNERVPGRLRPDFLLSTFTGKIDGLDERFANINNSSMDSGLRLTRLVTVLRIQNRNAEAIDLIERSDLQTIRQVGVGGAGRKPVAELHGWAKLMSKDAAGAARDGQIMLDFVEHELVTKWNGWYLRFLAAEGALFSGNKPQAIADARAALAMVARGRLPGPTLYANTTAASIFAWAGAEDDAVALLEEVSKGFPGIGPAAITRDPLYSIPLKNNARYKVLEKKLEAEIAENRKLL